MATQGQNDANSTKRLRIGTYLVPSIPVEFFESVNQYLELKLGVETSLIYESRWEAPPSNRSDPFANNEIDLAWVPSSYALKCIESKNKNVEVLPVSMVNEHARAEDKAGVFVDVIVHQNYKENVKAFIDLRGCNWAYPHPDSLTGHLVTLHNLKKSGENASFFGNILQSGSHLESIRMVLGKRADGAAVDSTVLLNFLDRNPHVRDELVVLCSWGPLAPHALVARSGLNEDVKESLIHELLNMHNNSVGAAMLKEHHIKKFSLVSRENFMKERDIIENTKRLTLNRLVYY